MTSVNIKRVVDNIRSGTTIYTPVIELVVNAIQAVRELRPIGGTITVTVLRSGQTDLIDKIPAVAGFVVQDDGVGFDQIHRDAFDTLYTALKAESGGKGFGRFTCLKYFDQMSIESVFLDDDRLKYRSFNVGLANDIIVDETVKDAEDAAVGSKVTIAGIRSIKFPDKGLETIARVLVEKLLPYFIDQSTECPRIVMRDTIADVPEIVLNDYLLSDSRQIVELRLSKSEIAFSAHESTETLAVRVFKFYSPRLSKSKVSLVAHRREVTETTIQSYIPEFADEFYDSLTEGGTQKDRNYVIKAYVLGDYLDSNVSLERGGFNFQKDSDLVFGISQSQIERVAAEAAREAIGTEIRARQERKRKRIAEYVETEAPWHRTIAGKADFSSLPMQPSSEEIEIYLQTAKFKIEMQARAQVKQILASTDPYELSDKTLDLVGNISESSKNDLIHYVSMRRCVLDLFSKNLEKDANGKYKSEGDVHNIIMPRRKDIDEIDFEQHNLWILDERLNFSSYISSDKPLDGKVGGRSDITVYGKRIAFRGENESSNPIIIFEFKKPRRDDFANPSSEEDPVQQIVRYVNDIRDGKYYTPRGRDILVSENTPFYGYVVCDFDKKVRNWLEREKDFTVMPDGLGFFKWYGNIKLYIEVLSWEKIQRDAGIRNKIFFHKLGV